MDRYLAALTIKNLFSILVIDQPKLLFYDFFAIFIMVSISSNE